MHCIDKSTVSGSVVLMNTASTNSIEFTILVSRNLKYSKVVNLNDK